MNTYLSLYASIKLLDKVLSNSALNISNSTIPKKSKRTSNRLNKTYHLAIVFIVIAALGCIKPLYLYSKALLAQYLLHETWEEVKAQHAINNVATETKTLKAELFGSERLTILPPWSWADTYPIAKLSLRFNTVKNALGNISDNVSTNVLVKVADNLLDYTSDNSLKNISLKNITLKSSDVTNTTNNPILSNRISTEEITMLSTTHSMRSITNSTNNSPDHSTNYSTIEPTMYPKAITSKTESLKLESAQAIIADGSLNKTPEISWIILAGMTGRTMAFGPGWLQDSAKPNQSGNTVISAHNDSHFAILENVNIGDTFILEDQNSYKEEYQITAMRIVNENDNSAYQYSELKMLTLITCYPFTLTQGDKTKRLIVTAIAT